jgi:hypothetical protein
MFAIRSRAAAECKTGTFFLAMTEAMIAASLRVQPFYQVVEVIKHDQKRMSDNQPPTSETRYP